MNTGFEKRSANFKKNSPVKFVILATLMFLGLPLLVLAAALIGGSFINTLSPAPVKEAFDMDELAGFWCEGNTGEERFCGLEFRADGSGTLYSYNSKESHFPIYKPNGAYGFTYTISNDGVSITVTLDGDDTPALTDMPVAISGDSLKLYYTIELTWINVEFERLSSIKYDDGIITAQTIGGEDRVFDLTVSSTDISPSDTIFN